MKRKEFSFVIVLLISLFLGINSVNAASASISVSANTKTVVVGNSVKVTVTVSSPYSANKSGLGSWEYCISYDTNVLKLSSSTADANTCVKTGVVSTVGQKSSSETFTFKAIKSGNSKVTVKSYAVYDYYTESQVSTTVGSVAIKTMTQAELEATYSTNANLKNIVVDGYELTPKFAKDVYEYSLEVENEVETVKITAAKEDSTASVNGTGDITLLEGNNKVEIVVTAQKGNRQTYVVNVYRKELDPIDVTVDGTLYNIVRRADVLPEFKTFTPTTVMYEDTEIPALYSEITGITIVGLKDEEGNVYTYVYENNEITYVYVEINNNIFAINPLELPENDLFASYQVKEITINDAKINAYVIDDDSKYAIVYAQNVETGEINYYSYYMVDGTFQVYDKDLTNFYEKRITNYKYVLIGLIGFIIILLLILLTRKPKKKIKKEIINEALVQTIENHIDNEINAEIKNVENVKKESELKELLINTTDKKEEEKLSEEEKLENEEIQVIKEDKKKAKREKRENKKKEKIRNDFDF